MRLPSKQSLSEAGGFTIFEIMECAFGASIALLFALFMRTHFVWATGPGAFFALWLGGTVILGFASVIVFSCLCSKLGKRWVGVFFLVLLLATLTVCVVVGSMIGKHNANPRSGIDTGTELCWHVSRCSSGANHRDC